MFGIVDMTLEAKVKVTYTLNCEVEGFIFVTIIVCGVLMTMKVFDLRYDWSQRSRSNIIKTCLGAHNASYP